MYLLRTGSGSDTFGSIGSIIDRIVTIETREKLLGTGSKWLSSSNSYPIIRSDGTHAYLIADSMVSQAHGSVGMVTVLFPNVFFSCSVCYGESKIHSIELPPLNDEGVAELLERAFDTHGHSDEEGTILRTLNALTHSSLVSDTKNKCAYHEKLYRMSEKQYRI